MSPIIDIVLIGGMLLFLWFIQKINFLEHLELALPLIVYLVLCTVTSFLSVSIADVFGSVETVYFATLMFTFMSTGNYFFYSYDIIVRKNKKKITIGKSLFNVFYVSIINVAYFALAYASMYSFDNKIFNGHIGVSLFDRSVSFLYFSFITFTTIGYGDISPIGSYARIMVMMEGLFSLITIVLIFTSFNGLSDITTKD